MNKKISADEMLEILQQQWADYKDIRKIACVGISKAQEIKKEIADKLEQEMYLLPKGLVPMKSVIEHLRIDISYLKKMAKGVNKNG